MPTYPTYVTTDISSTNTTTSGAALSAQYAMQAYQQSHNKRRTCYLRTVAPTAGATATEAFIDGITNFRLALAANSTVLLKVFGTYNCSVAGSNTAFEITAGFYNNATVLTALANAISTKFPNAALPTLVITLSGQNLVFTCTGVAGDTNGNWSIRVEIEEVADV